MKLKLYRFIAILILVIPGLTATYGFLAMKDAFFAQFGEGGTHFLWGKFILGAFLFAIGVLFIGGWVFFRDRKRNYVSSRFKPKRDTLR